MITCLMYLCRDQHLLTWTDSAIYIFRPQSGQVLLWSEIKGTTIPVPTQLISRRVICKFNSNLCDFFSKIEQRLKMLDCRFQMWWTLRCTAASSSVSTATGSCPTCLCSRQSGAWRGSCAASGGAWPPASAACSPTPSSPAG